MNGMQITALERNSTKSQYVEAWCGDCDMKWEGESDFDDMKLAARTHAHRTRHRVIIREYRVTEYDF